MNFSNTSKARRIGELGTGGLILERKRKLKLKITFRLYFICITKL
jgi:hypothetical protein